MKAITRSQYGGPDVLRIVDIKKPVPGDDEVLIKVRAASANPYDWHFITGLPYVARLIAGIRKPKTGWLGVDVAGEVEAVGRDVTQFKPGDAVFGTCRGSFAEYACTRESALVTKPANVTFPEAAAVPVGAVTALQALRDRGRLQPGQKVLIHGAAGGVGTFAVQIAKSLGARVTAVCSTRNVEMVRSLGADHVIDYTRDDYTKSSERYDVIIDCIGNRSLRACCRVMTPRGTYVMVGGPDGRWIGPFSRLFKALLLSPFVSQRLVFVVTKSSQADLLTLHALMASGKVKPVIDTRYGLADTADAFRHLEQGHARGKIVITLD